MQTSDSSWSDEDREIDRLEKLVSENAADSLKWRTLLQNERDNMNAALLEIDRLKTVIGEMTINQQMQDSITAAVMERTERAESKIAHRNGQIVMAGMKVAELEAECAGLRVDAERYQWLRKQAHPTSPESFWVARSGYGPSGISIWWLESLDEAIDAERSK